MNILSRVENKMFSKVAEKTPWYIHTYELTAMTAIWAVGVVVFAYLAHTDSINWIHGISLMIVFQWFTDSLDGVLGRMRKERMKHWGYMADHFFDSLFVGGAIIGYMLIADSNPLIYSFILLFTMAGMGLGFISDYESGFGFLGANEIRILFITINVLIAATSPQEFSWIAPLVLVAVFLIMCRQVRKTFKKLWEYDTNETVQALQDEANENEIPLANVVVLPLPPQKD